MLSKGAGQATLEYLIALVMTVVIIAGVLQTLDLPIRHWWDAVARRISAPCPSKECAKIHTEPTVP